MNAQQNKIADRAIDELNQIRSQIASRTGNVADLTRRYNDILMEIKAGLHDVFGKMEGAVQKYWEKNNTINIHEIPTCGNLERQPKHSAGSEIVGAGVIDGIREEIQENPIDYSELQEITADASPGRGYGEEEKRIRVPNIGQPKWITELTSDLRLFRNRNKTKGYYDPESLARGIPAKQKLKKFIKSKTLWIVLDTSGSMMTTKSKGHSVLELVASYIVPIANQFQGELLQVDDGIPKPEGIYPLKTLRKATIEGLSVKGGGGTEFSEVFRFLNEKKEKFKKELGKDTDFMTIFLTDAIVDWNEDLIPDNFLIVTLEETASHLPFLDKARNQKAILIKADATEE